MKLILAGFLLLFIKVNFTIFDYSLIYIFTNIFGYLLIRIGIEKTDESDEIFMKDSLWFYATMNLILLLCILFGVRLESISLNYIDSYILAFTILFAHIYLFVYPMYLFMQFIFYLDRKSLCLKVSRIQNIMKVTIVLAVMISFSSFLISSIQYLWIMVIGLQLYMLIVLSKNSKTDKLINMTKK
ncbi:hypothetical protein B795N_02060 [Marinilactibacillus psychrotolerans]|uniref:Uncharacterized protein n=1 Tax=Marinilactibacillus psychrotolerans 42ea TaxID=1255609 RepID=A0A1R4K216_9LACT|nr:hypothetical protein B795N_02060 [Marinilactibacillus psychrotolerans]SJN38214.1 hypothetical protein FM115_07760 [Marinilactibacillus psychrotolerans 42ea]